jgi:hydrocephalus-inducing protein
VGVINPKSSQIVNITLKTEILSTIRIPLYVKVEGYHIPFMVTLLATSIGPIVSVNKTELEYNNVEVLKDYVEKLVIKNESKIPAEYTAFTKNKESVWKVVQRHGVLNPDEEKELDVVCNADEVQKFQDTLHIIINNGVDLEVALRAKGTGSTLFCKDNLNLIDFGTEYTHQNVTKEFFLENRGRKQMKIQWVRNVKNDRKPASAAPAKEGAKKEEGKATSEKKSDKASNAGESNAQGEKEEETKAIFSVIPDTIVLNPKMGIMIQIKANSQINGKIVENWFCNVVSGGDRKPKAAYNAFIQGDFITPTLNFSDPKLYFKYQWEKGVPSMPISKNLEITNGGPLGTSMNLLIDPPFSCATEKLALQPGQSDSILIKFDPGMKQDRLSDNISGKLAISHVGHPQKDLVQLTGEVCFPNLNILPPNIDFGCILNDTSKKKYITLTNISEMSVNYEWSFLEEEMVSPLKDEKKGSSKKSKILPINEVFDILPVSGMLMPGQTETVEFTFYSGHGLLYNGVAVCSVDGGPDYEVPIVGESSFVSYKLSTTELDYGEIPYNESSSKEFFIENIGKVPFQYNINLTTVSRPGIVDCHPMTGKVAAGEKYKVIVKFFPGIPSNIDEMFLVECAHFPA